MTLDKWKSKELDGFAKQFGMERRMGSKPDIERAVISRVPDTHACVVTPMSRGKFRVDVSANVDIAATGPILVACCAVVEDVRGAGSIPSVTVHGGVWGVENTRALSRLELTEIGFSAREKELVEELAVLERVAHERDCWKEIATFMMAAADPDGSLENWREHELPPVEITDVWLTNVEVKKHVEAWWNKQLAEYIVKIGLANMRCPRCTNGNLIMITGGVTFCRVCDRYAGIGGLRCCASFCYTCVQAEVDAAFFEVSRDYIGLLNTPDRRAAFKSQFAAQLARRVGRIALDTGRVDIAFGIDGKLTAVVGIKQLTDDLVRTGARIGIFR